MNNQILKENLIKNLESDINKYKQFLQYFSLNTENYSRALQIDLEEFSQKRKESEEFLSTNEKNKLIFIKNESLIDSEKIININYNLIIMKRNLENFKLKLINLKNNLDKNKNNFDKFAFSGEKNLIYIVSELQTFKGFKNNPNSLIDEKNVFFI